MKRNTYFSFLREMSSKSEMGSKRKRECDCVCVCGSSSGSETGSYSPSSKVTRLDAGDGHAAGYSKSSIKLNMRPN